MLIKILQGVPHGTLEADFKIHTEEQRAKNIQDVLKKKSKKGSCTLPDIRTSYEANEFKESDSEEG